MEDFGNQGHQGSLAQGRTPYMLQLINDLESSKKKLKFSDVYKFIG